MQNLIDLLFSDRFSLCQVDLSNRFIVMETGIGKLKMKRKKNNFMIPSVEARYKLMTPTVINFIQSCYKEDSILLSQFDLFNPWFNDGRKMYLLTDVWSRLIELTIFLFYIYIIVETTYFLRKIIFHHNYYLLNFT